MRFIVFAVILLVSIDAEAQYRVNERRSVEWDHDNVGSLRSFQTSIDGSGFSDTGLALQWLLPILPVGKHIVSVRACTTIECSSAISLAFEILPVVPTEPSRLRLTPAAATPVSVEQAVEVAHSYSYLWRLHRLDATELQFLAERYNGPIPPNLSALINYLEMIFVEFAR